MPPLSMLRAASGRAWPALCGLTLGCLLVVLVSQAHSLRVLRATLQSSQATCEEARSFRREVLRRLDAPVPPLTSLTTDLFLRNLGGSPNDDPPQTQRFLLALAVGPRLMTEVDKLVQKFDPALFSIVLFHYSGDGGAWQHLPWASKAIHVSAARQTKWWFAKRFLTPAVVSRYDLVFVWDEDLGADNFDARRYVQIVQTAGLEISQPGVVGPYSWPITRRVPGGVLHKHSEYSSGDKLCSAQERDQPPCGAYVEVMVPVFTARAWQCVWSMLPNDLVHVFGVDLTWQVCATGGNRTAAEAMGIVDETYIEHLRIPSLAEQGQATADEPAWMNVDRRRSEEWSIWTARWKAATKREEGVGR